MATKSIYKNINIRTKETCRRLANALENASDKQAKDVVFSKKVREVKKEDIKKLFTLK